MLKHNNALAALSSMLNACFH